MAPLTLNVVCFRFHPSGIDDTDDLNRLNETLLKHLNASGKIYLTHTKLRDCYTLRMVIAQTHVEARNVEAAWELIRLTAATI
jgi:aromatic-L-amino-acid/L-tryptophan decarboxylase